jgi:hypothetical protein
MNIFHYIASLLTTVLTLLGVVQATPSLPQSSVDQATQVAQQAIAQANNSLPQQSKELLTFIKPKSGSTISAHSAIVVQWQPLSAELQKKFKGFWVVLEVVDSSGLRVGSVGDGQHLDETSTAWNIESGVRGGFYSLKPYEYYYIRASLQAGSDLSLGCDPAMPYGPKDCAVLYSDETKKLMKEAKNYVSTSGPFTFYGLDSNPISVSGMEKYTDAGFGFSFWYPSGLELSSATKNPEGSNLGSNYGPNTRVLKQIRGKDLFLIDEVYSPDTSIYYQESAGPFGSDIDHYYFDTQAHTWMDVNDGGPAGKYPGGTKPADVSKNTMGGLHMLYGYARFSSEYVIPLSAHNFLVVSRLYADGHEDNIPLFDAFVKTIVATDPSVATPVSAAEQIKIIQAEKDAYKVTSGTVVGMTTGSIAVPVDGIILRFHGLYSLRYSVDFNSRKVVFYPNAQGTQPVEHTVDQSTIDMINQLASQSLQYDYSHLSMAVDSGYDLTVSKGGKPQALHLDKSLPIEAPLWQLYNLLYKNYPPAPRSVEF